MISVIARVYHCQPASERKDVCHRDGFHSQTPWCVLQSVWLCESLACRVGRLLFRMCVVSVLANALIDYLPRMKLEPLW